VCSNNQYLIFQITLTEFYVSSLKHTGGANEVFLPELGDSVWLPYNHIDELLELCYARLNHPEVEPPPQLARKVELLEVAMQTHFEKLLLRECFMDHTRRVAAGQVR
jgi:hypothetical protein